jgi:hypothetical protein
MSFRDLRAWGLAIPYFGYAEASEVTVVNKASRDFHESIRDLIKVA